MSLDLVRATEKSPALNAFISVCGASLTHDVCNTVRLTARILQWARDIITSCPSTLGDSLSGPIASLRIGVDALVDTYKAPMHPLLPRPALFLFAHVASSAYLLEHAIWAVKTSEASRDVDVEVFRRWVVEGAFDVALENVRKVKNLPAQERVQTDADIVYGAERVRVPARL